MDPIEMVVLGIMVVLAGAVGGLVSFGSSTNPESRRQRRTAGQWVGTVVVVLGTVVAFVGFGPVWAGLSEGLNVLPGAMTLLSGLALAFAGIGMLWDETRWRDRREGTRRDGSQTIRRGYGRLSGRMRVPNRPASIGL